MFDSAIWLVLIGGYVLTWLLIPYVLLKRKVHASAAVAWILAIIFLPYVGAFLCLLIGTTRWERHTGRKQAASARIRERIPQQVDSFVDDVDQLHGWRPTARLVQSLTGTHVLKGNEVQLLPDTRRSLDVVEEMVESARSWVHVEFYIWKHDDVGTQLRDLLIRKARQGVQVRLLYDGVGSMQLSREFLKPLEQAGAQTALFTPGFSFWHLLTLNLRNHRKIVVTDQQLAFTGGMNIGDEYLRPTKGFGEWRDTQLLLRGPAALQLQQVFAEDWFYATEEELTATEYFPQPRAAGAVPAQIIADGPDSNENAFYLLALAALGQARQRVTLATPYFVPPEGLAVALAATARRGVHVRVMVAERGNFTWTLQAGRSYYESLLAAGVEIFEYGKGLYHPKTLSIDGQWALVGTPNWDYRSLVLNFEVAVSLYSPQLAEELEEHFQRDLKFARQIQLDEWRQRSKLTILHEEFWRLFAPML